MEKFANRLILWARKWPVFLAISGLFLALVFAFLNPVATQQLSLGARIGFWLFQVMSLLLFMQTALLVLQRVGTFFRWPKILQFVLSGLLGSTIFVPISLLLDLFLGLDESPSSLAEFWHPLLLEELSFISPPAVIAWSGLNAIRSWRGDSSIRNDSEQRESEFSHDRNLPVASDQELPSGQEIPSIKTPAFFDLIPRYLGKDVVAAAAELHYLRVYTKLGQALILYPFGRAVEELNESNILGLKVHRSHWVARRHIIEIKRSRSRLMVITSIGLIVPVSRRKAAEVSNLDSELA